MPQWTLKLNFHAYSMDSLRAVVAQAAAQVAKARVPADLMMHWSGGDGLNQEIRSGCASEYTCPTEDRIKELRREADRLETELSK